MQHWGKKKRQKVGREEVTLFYGATHVVYHQDWAPAPPGLP